MQRLRNAGRAVRRRLVERQGRREVPVLAVKDLQQAWALLSDPEITVEEVAS